MGHTLDSISYFHKALELRPHCSIQESVIPILSLVKDYLKINDISNAKKWIQEGLELT
jgi:hypothetical protein